MERDHSPEVRGTGAEPLTVFGKDFREWYFFANFARKKYS